MINIKETINMATSMRYFVPKANIIVHTGETFLNETTTNNTDHYNSRPIKFSG